MPIKPENRYLYPPKKEWRQIRGGILERAGNRCESCGIANHTHAFKLPSGDRIPFWDDYNTKEGHLQITISPPKGSKLIKVILSIAHLDQDPTNNDPENLAALCQQCHNRQDRPTHLAHRRHKPGQMNLLTGTTYGAYK